MAIAEASIADSFRAAFDVGAAFVVELRLLAFDLRLHLHFRMPQQKEWTYGTLENYGFVKDLVYGFVKDLVEGFQRHQNLLQQLSKRTSCDHKVWDYLLQHSMKMLCVHKDNVQTSV